MGSYFVGIDIGTQGARVILLDEKGRQVSAAEEVFLLEADARNEQDPGRWWDSCISSLKKLCAEASKKIDLVNVKAISVTSTSGTIVPLDKNNQPLHAAIMYSDPRSAPEALWCKEKAKDARTQAYSSFNASSGLPKMIWFLNHFPEKKDSIGKFVHAADFIIGRLTGNFGVTDYTNALKSGYDVHKCEWPSYLWETVGLKKGWLQEVVPSGTVVGTLRQELAVKFRLPENVLVTAGMTDGCASQIASGAVRLGDWNTTIGTTLVIKGVTSKEIHDPTGALYAHRHPQGYWMPGGASNTGADWVSRLFPDVDITSISDAADKYIPTGHLVWPLLQKGERFPFIAPEARGFGMDGLTGAELFAACMEGVAFIERFAYERIAKLSGEKPARVYSAGGGSGSDTWLTIRSAVLKLPICKMQQVSGAAGAAILAASQTHYTSLTAAAEAMVHPERQVDPDPGLAEKYEKKYQQFIALLKQKNIITV